MAKPRVVLALPGPLTDFGIQFHRYYWHRTGCVTQGLAPGRQIPDPSAHGHLHTALGLLEPQFIVEQCRTSQSLSEQ